MPYSCVTSDPGIGEVAVAQAVVASRVRHAEIDVRVLGEVVIPAQMADVAQLAALRRLEQRRAGLVLAGGAVEHLAGRLEEDPRVRNQPRHRNARVVDAVFAADQVLRDQRAIRPRQDVIVERVDLAEGRAHLADLGQQAAGQLGEGDEPFLEVDAFLAERNEEIGARVRVDDRLERDLRFVHLERRNRVDVVRPGGAEKIADDRDVRVEHLAVVHRRAERRRGLGRRRRPGVGGGSGRAAAPAWDPCANALAGASATAAATIVARTNRMTFMNDPLRGRPSARRGVSKREGCA